MGEKDVCIVPPGPPLGASPDITNQLRTRVTFVVAMSHTFLVGMDEADRRRSRQRPAA
jgi:hypothetical protein